MNKTKGCLIANFATVPVLDLCGLGFFVVAKMGQNAVKGAKMGQQKCWLLWFIVVVDVS
ncbi:hypothetical protein [Escherichia coli]|uniref:hypothetical protein n=1 Tax=Escherichia coli TaxID=562 RepID=UPI0032B5F62D